MRARYDEEGADEITLLDITASHEGRGTMLDVVARTADATFIPLTVGGGVRSEDDVRALLEAGADKVSINTAAVQEPELVERCADAWGVAGHRRRDRREEARPENGSGWDVYIHGGRTKTGLDAIAWAEEVAKLGAGEILLTSMDRDGTHAGYDLELVARGRGRRADPRHRDRRRRDARAPARRALDGPRGRGARGVDLPRRHAHDRRGEALPRARTASPCGCS